MKIPATIIYLTDEQIEQLQGLRTKVQTAHDIGKPGFLAAQIFGDKLFAFFIEHDKALKVQELMGQKVGEVRSGESVLARALGLEQ